MRRGSLRACWNARSGKADVGPVTVEQRTPAHTRIPTECVSWRGHGNLGDEMMSQAQEAMFGSVLDLGQYIEAPAAVLVGGGTFVPKYPEHPDLLELSRRLPTALFGTGIGDPLFWGRQHIPDWLEIMRNARFVGVRGPLSKDRLEDWGLPADHVEWIGDPALYFASVEAPRRTVQGELAVNLGITYGNLYGFDEAQVEAAVVRCLESLARAGWGITLVCAWEPDGEALERIKAQVPVKAVEHWHGDYATALRSMAKFDVVLSEKLHVAVVAACRAVPFVALNYRSKVLDFCRSIEWEAFCVSTERLEPERVDSLITALAKSRPAHSERLARGVAAVRTRLLDAVPRAVSALVREAG